MTVYFIICCILYRNDLITNQSIKPACDIVPLVPIRFWRRSPGRTGSMLATALGGERRPWDSEVMGSKPCPNSWSNWAIIDIYPATSACWHVLMSYPCKIISFQCVIFSNSIFVWRSTWYSHIVSLTLCNLVLSYQSACFKCAYWNHIIKSVTFLRLRYRLREISQRSLKTSDIIQASNGVS